MTKANTKTNSGKLTKRDLFRANWRWLWGSQLSWNYERMMAPGYFYAVLPFLRRRISRNDADANSIFQR